MGTLYPYGYGTGRVDLDGLKTKYAKLMHPEYARRLFAWLEAQGGKFGIGGGWRPTGAQLDENGNVKPGFAGEGKSFHQTQSFNDGFKGYCAVDLVAYVGGGRQHRSPYTHETPPQGTEAAKKWGLHCNVGKPGERGYEPWHMQPIEIDGHYGWTKAGRPAPKRGYPLPSEAPAAPPKDEPPAWPPVNFHTGKWGLWPFNTSKPKLSNPSYGDAVKYLQSVIYHRAGGNGWHEGHAPIVIDGHFGKQTEYRVRNMQKFFGLHVDGWVGKQTWGIVDYLAGKR